MKCDLSVQTAVAPKYIRYVTNLEPHTVKTWVGLEKVGFVTFKLSGINLEQVTWRQKK